MRVSRPTSIDVEIEPVRVSRPTSLDVEIEPARASRPTSFDVEIDCVERSEPPPASRPQRKRAWLALISGVCLLGASGALFFGRSAALHASRVIDATVSAGAARTPAMLTNAALETKTSPAPVQTRAPAPNPASNGKARSKPPIHTQRAQAPVVSGSSKKPPEPVRSRHAQRKAT
ncbi:MAG TPA: hypothetical protein VFK05_01165 [Polyangiaceae bacterium]|nr:hypothetical protein [Polyangiaceae bacterium]